MKKFTFILCLLVASFTQAQISQTFKNVTINDSLLSAPSDSTILVKGHLIPSLNNTYSLGTLTKRWNIGYFDSIVTRVVTDTVVYPDSSVLFVGSNGRPTTDSTNFLWDNVSKQLLIRNSALIPYTRTVINTYGSGSGGQGAISMGVSSNSSTQPPRINFHKSRGTSTAPTLNQANDELGGVLFQGYDGTAWNNVGARIDGIASQNWSTANHSSYIRFRVVAKNTTGSSPVTGLIIVDNGNVAVGPNVSTSDSLYGLTINGTVMARVTPPASATDSLLNKASTGQIVATAYSQGVYVPVDSAGSNVDGVTPDTAFYTRVGNIVTVSGVVEIDPTTTLTPTFFYMNVPVFPLNWGVNRAGGTFSAYIVNEGGAAIMGGPTSVLFQFLPVSVGANNFSYTYSYRIQ